MNQAINCYYAIRSLCQREQIQSGTAKKLHKNSIENVVGEYNRHFVAKAVDQGFLYIQWIPVNTEKDTFLQVVSLV